jgi:hypothetical protein
MKTLLAIGLTCGLAAVSFADSWPTGSTVYVGNYVIGPNKPHSAPGTCTGEILATGDQATLTPSGPVTSIGRGAKILHSDYGPIPGLDKVGPNVGTGTYTRVAWKVGPPGPGQKDDWGKPEKEDHGAIATLIRYLFKR